MQIEFRNSTALSPFDEVLAPYEKNVVLRFLLFPILKKVLCLAKLNQIYSELRDLPPYQFIDELICRLHVSVSFDKTQLKNIPQQGPAIIIANHPYGGLDALLLIQLVKEVRPDFKILGNYLIGHITQLADMLICVDPFQTQTGLNMGGMRSAINYVKDGHLLLVFPAGVVSHFRLRHGKVTDPEWKGMIAKLLRLTQSSITPVHFSGRNSFKFHVAGVIHPLLRTLLLPSELLNKGGSHVMITIGNLVSYQSLSNIEKKKMPDFLRRLVYNLGR